MLPWGLFKMGQCVGLLKGKPGNDVLSRIDKLDDTIADMEIKVAFIDQAIVALKKKADKLKKEGNTKTAISALKRKQFKVDARDRLLQATETLGFMRDTLDESVTYAVASNALIESNAVLTELNRKINVDSVSDIIDRCEEHMNNAAEIFEVISGAGQSQFDEDELLQELEDIGNDNSDVNEVVYMPPAPTTKQKNKQQRQPLLVAQIN